MRASHARPVKLALTAAVAAAIIAVVAIAAGAFDGGSSSSPGTTAPHRAAPLPAHEGLRATPPAVPAFKHGPIPKRPNIVFVLTDDLSTDLVPYLPNVRRMMRQGTSFSHYYVTDSLCCPSRASIFTGRYPHDTHVLGNSGTQGGYHAWLAHSDQAKSFAPVVRRGGYQTALLGKYLNRYHPQKLGMPPGWTTWGGVGWGYNEYNYTMNVDGRPRHFGAAPRSYLTSVLRRRAVNFVDGAARARSPFLLEVSTFAPHRPSTPAPRDLSALPFVRAPRPPSFNRAVRHAPPWLQGRGRLGAANQLQEDRDFRRRAQSMLAVDRMIGRLRAELRRRHLAKRTYFVFSSDNGYHLGQHRLLAGKQTAFDTDIRVPLVVVGPGVPKGRTVTQLAENIDLGPTFAQLTGRPIPPGMDGRSLAGLIHGRTPANWRDAVLIEHHRPVPAFDDPDIQGFASGVPPTYAALRTQVGTYVEYVDGSREYYDTVRDPNELDNTYHRLPRRERRRLHRALRGLTHCHGGAACWRAAHIPPMAR